MLARRFFYVSAALLLLALSHDASIPRADAQSPGSPFVGVVGPSGCSHMAVTANGDCYTTTDQTNWQHTGNVFSPEVQVPGNPVIGVAATNSCGHMVITANGDCYVTTDNGASWRRTGSVLGMPTPASASTWGKVKADYRK